ncbi:MAG: ATP-grasp domain-containing protein [Bacillota bacterium]
MLPVRGQTIPARGEPRIRAFVTDARYRMTLAVIRSLGRAGVKVTAAEQRGGLEALGFHSRYCHRRVLLPAAAAAGFTDTLLAAAAGHDALIPVGLGTLFAVATERERVRSVLPVAVVDADTLDTANATDKLLRVAVRAGIPTPHTTWVTEDTQLADVASALSYPAVVKYRRGEELGLGPGDRYAIVQDAEALLAAYSKMHARQSFPLIQDYVPGDGYGVAAVFDAASAPVAVFAHRRLREYPISGGPSTLCESVVAPDLIEQGVELLRALRWYGVAMVEFKRDRRDGVYRLMEINPRFWGSLPLAIAAGVDVPLALFLVTVGRQVPAMPCRPGVRLRFLLQDMRAAADIIRRPGGSGFIPRYLLELADWRVRHGVFSLGDPVPACAYLARAGLKLLQGRGGDGSP